MFRPDCSNEELIAYLDGELDRRRARRVRKHLERCWQCRARHDELHRQSLEIARLVEDDSFLGPARMAAAKFTLERKRREWERARVAAPEFRLTRSRAGAWTLGSLAAAAGLMLAFMLPPEPPQPPSARRLLASVQLHESLFEQTARPVRQQFEVEVTEQAPAGRTSRGELEILFDRSSGRFAARWRDEAKTLRHAILRPEPGRELVYRRSDGWAVERAFRSPPQEAPVVELARFGLSAASFEQGFQRWLEMREWRPIAFSRNLMLLAGDGGVYVRVEPGPRGAWLLKASRHVQGGRLEITVEVHPRSFEPRAQTISFEKDGRRTELRLRSRRTELLNDAGLSAALFQPDMPVAVPLEAEQGPPLAVTPPALWLPRAGDLPAARPDLGMLEAEVRSAIHRTGLCTGAGLKVNRGGLWLELSGFVESEHERRRLLATLPQSRWLRLSVRSIETLTGDAGWEALGAQRQEMVRGKEPSLMHLLGRGALPAADLDRLSREALAVSDHLRRHVWTVQQLVDHYGGQDEVFSAAARELINAMLQDHLREIELQARQIVTGLMPVLERAAGPAAPLRDFPAPSSWRGRAQLLEELVLEVRSHVSVLFSDAESTPAAAADSAIALRDRLQQLAALSTAVLDEAARDPLVQPLDHTTQPDWETPQPNSSFRRQ